jgi:hypothetical protein
VEFSFEEIADTQSSANTRIILSVYPTNFLSNRLLMPCWIQAIPLRATDLGAYRTPDLVRLKPLSKLLIYIIFTASKA